MELFTVLFGPGIAGGVIVALWLTYLHRHARPSGDAVPRGEGALLVDAINISHIRVAGLGGLGLVAMALVVAVFVPAIRIALAIALPSGVLMAVAKIVWRRRQSA